MRERLTPRRDRSIFICAMLYSTDMPILKVICAMLCNTDMPILKVICAMLCSTDMPILKVALRGTSALAKSVMNNTAI